MKRLKTLISIFLSLLLISSPVIADQANFEDAFSPHQGATELIVKTIHNAKKSIHVAAYSFTSKPIGSALVEAHDRGIDVEIVLDKSADDENFKEKEYLNRHNIPIRINGHYKIMHDKFMIIDGDALELGSFNYTKAAENNNAENVLVLRNAQEVVADYEKQWQKLWRESK